MSNSSLLDRAILAEKFSSPIHFPMLLTCGLITSIALDISLGPLSSDMGVKRILAICLVMFGTASQLAKIFTSKTHMQGQTVLLVIAHPDDESMFFGPSVRHVLNNKNDLYFLVLSNGDADGIGTMRELEMKAAVPLLGGKQENTLVVDDPRLQDGTDWDPSVVSKYIKNQATKIKAQTIITFDAEGVSGHINHRSCSEGAFLAARELNINSRNLVSLFTLQSVPLWRKYLFSLDAFISRLSRKPSGQYTLISGSIDYSIVRRALTNGHNSQMLWYRWLWSMFSRYMIVNDLVEVNVGNGLQSEEFKLNSEKYTPIGSNIRTAVIPSITKAKVASSASVSRPVTRHKPIHNEL